jgi:TetR/AcrR family transcriptional regulator, regulator of autoinduction and epiphytic fitness
MAAHADEQPGQGALAHTVRQPMVAPRVQTSPVTSPEMPSAPSTLDGRHQRRERNRAAVVDAILELLREGELRPGAEAIAERAGISVRSVFRHFDDLDSLLAFAVERQIESVAALYGAPSSKGNTTVRASELVHQRRTLYEEISPVRRAATRLAPFHPVLRSRLEYSHRLLRNQLRDLFSPELAVLPSRERKLVLDALDSATSWSTWEGLRTDIGLTPSRAGSVVASTVTALLSSALSRRH